MMTTVRTCDFIPTCDNCAIEHPDFHHSVQQHPDFVIVLIDGSFPARITYLLRDDSHTVTCQPGQDLRIPTESGRLISVEPALTIRRHGVFLHHSATGAGIFFLLAQPGDLVRRTCDGEWTLMEAADRLFIESDAPYLEIYRPARQRLDIYLANCA